MITFGGGATAELPPGGRGGHFPKWPPADISDIWLYMPIPRFCVKNCDL